LKKLVLKNMGVHEPVQVEAAVPASETFKTHLKIFGRMVGLEAEMVNPECLDILNEGAYENPLTYLLHWCVAKGKLQTVQTLIATFKLNPNARNRAGETSLHVACTKNQAEMVKLLMASGANHLIPDGQMESGWSICAFMGHLECLKELWNAVVSTRKQAVTSETDFLNNEVTRMVGIPRELCQVVADMTAPLNLPGIHPVTGRALSEIAMLRRFPECSKFLERIGM